MDWWYRQMEGQSGTSPDREVYGANMGPIWVLSAPDGPIGPMNLVIREYTPINFIGREYNYGNNQLSLIYTDGNRAIAGYIHYIYIYIFIGMILAPCFKIRTAFPGIWIVINKMVLWPWYIYNVNSYTGKMEALHWDSPRWTSSDLTVLNYIAKYNSISCRGKRLLVCLKYQQCPNLIWTILREQDQCHGWWRPGSLH